MTAARCLFCGRGFLGTAEQVHQLFTSHDCDAPIAATPSLMASQAARLPATHGNRVPVEAGETPAPGAPIREDGGAVVGVETPGAGPLDWFTSRLAGVYALERRFRLNPKESL